MSDEEEFEPTFILCPLCLHDGRIQRTEYSFQMSLYKCLIHGFVITDEELYLILTERG